MNLSRQIKAAFTLIELLVVMAVIGVMVGSLGLVLRDGDKSMAMQAAQSSLSSLVAGARARAAIDAGQNASIIIWANPADSETYLRRAVVMVNHGAYWVQSGDSIDLPTGVFVVPPNAASAATPTPTIPAALETVADWYDKADPQKLIITEASLNDANYTPQTGSAAVQQIDGRIWNSSTSTYDADPAFTAVPVFITVSFNPYGQLINNAVQTLVVATGEIVPNTGVIFRNAESMRGLHLSTYGIPTLVNEKNGFQ